jgi:hypothetical protein
MDFLASWGFIVACIDLLLGDALAALPFGIPVIGDGDTMVNIMQ